jgi:hypothetical protein
MWSTKSDQEIMFLSGQEKNKIPKGIYPLWYKCPIVFLVLALELILIC